MKIVVLYITRGDLIFRPHPMKQLIFGTSTHICNPFFSEPSKWQHECDATYVTKQLFSLLLTSSLLSFTWYRGVVVSLSTTRHWSPAWLRVRVAPSVWEIKRIDIGVRVRLAAGKLGWWVVVVDLMNRGRWWASRCVWPNGCGVGRCRGFHGCVVVNGDGACLKVKAWAFRVRDIRPSVSQSTKRPAPRDLPL